MARMKKSKTPRPPAVAMTAARLIEPKAIPSPTYQQVADRAYQIWLAKGCPDDEDQTNWFEAENQLKLIG